MAADKGEPGSNREELRPMTVAEAELWLAARTGDLEGRLTALEGRLAAVDNALMRLQSEWHIHQSHHGDVNPPGRGGVR